MHVHLCNIGHVYTVKEDQERLLESVKCHAAGGIKTAGEPIKHGSDDPANRGSSQGRRRLGLGRLGSKLLAMNRCC